MPKLKFYRRVLFAALTAAFVCLLSGCFARSVEEFYALPRHSDAYYELQKAIDVVMSEGMQYAAPVSGGNRQSVQLADLDGDGEDEAIVFLRAQTELPLHAYIFDCTDGEYVCLGGIEGSGAAFESAEYADLDGDGGEELILGRQLSGQVLRAMSVYSVHGDEIVERMSANYSEYTLSDLDADGTQELLLFRLEPESRTGTAELCCWREGEPVRTQEVQMTAGVQDIRRILTGTLQPDVPAVFTASSCGDGQIVTDVFALKNGALENITSGIAQTPQADVIFAQDIDSDGLTELPQLVTPLPQEDGSQSGCIIRWYSLSLSASTRFHLTTYHSFSGGWYLALPDGWEDAITVSRGEEVSGTSGLVFSQWDTEKQTAVPAFTLYAFSSDDRAALAVQDGRFVVAEKGGVTYAASVGTGAWAKTITEESLREMFHFIHIDWNSGER